MKRFALFSALAALIGAVVLSCSGSDDLIVKTTGGLVQGIIEDGVEAYYGIPYAKAERFMPPQPVVKWDTVKVCDYWGPVCMQSSAPSEHNTPMTEDCCVLNVWTSGRDAKKPVLLWVHGGGFTSGTSAWNPGMGIAAKDVVFVSIHHRINILGFLDLSACGEKYKYSGNVSMLDVIASLEWVRDNIEAFGGDPSNVTVIGQSGGGAKVGTLLCMPKAKDLFQKAILMSGAFKSTNTAEVSSRLGLAVLEELGISPDEVEKINDVPYAELAAAGNRAIRKVGGAFAPTLDGDAVVQLPYDPDFSSFSADKPLIIGSTFNDLQKSYYDQEMTLDEAKEMLRPRLGDDVDRYVEAFAKAWPEFVPQDLLSIDQSVRGNIINTMDALAESWNAPVYNYMFKWKSEVTHMAEHGVDVNFTFNVPWLEKKSIPNPRPEDLAMADAMSQAWVNFAYTGDPNVEGQPEWHPYTVENGECYIFDLDFYTKNNFDRGIYEILADHKMLRR